MSTRIREIRGTITLGDGSVSEFTLGTDGAWQQWGASRERLGDTVDALQTIAETLLENDSLADSAEED